ncbi:hypothetical protein [uncultured Helicobacter sp.]
MSNVIITGDLGSIKLRFCEAHRIRVSEIHSSNPVGGAPTHRGWLHRA